MMDIVESYMRFRLNEEETFWIEKSNALARIECVMACECVVLIGDKLCMIEAKSSAPAPGNKKCFDKFIEEIARKFLDTLLLYNAIKLERHGENAISELPEKMRCQSGKAEYKMYLIIHGHETEWMVDIQNALQMKMQHILRAWGIHDSSLKAINHEVAKSLCLIEDYFPIHDLEVLKKEGKTAPELDEIARKWLADRAK